MPRLLNHSRAVFEIGKLEDYCLDPMHPRGRHKARVFREALGIGKVDAAWLRAEIMAVLADSEAFEDITDRYGSRWRLDVPVGRQNRRVVIRTIWIIRTGEGFPRFVTCWVL